MKLPFNHHKKIKLYGDVCTFYVLNIFKVKKESLDLDEILKLDLLHEKFLHEQDYAAIVPKETSFLPRINETTFKDYDYYGSLLKSNIKISDFEDLNYLDYLDRIVNMFKNWEANDEDDLLLKQIRAFHHRSLKDLEDFNLKSRRFYLLEAPLTDYTDDHSFHWTYGRFITVISVDPYSQNLFIINFGND